MLTKQEREEIAERFRNYDKAEYVTFYSGMYDGLLGEHVPKETTVKKDRMELASRILELCDTSNMLELPVDKDGEVIRIGDTVFSGADIMPRRVHGYEFKSDGCSVLLNGDGIRSWAYSRPDMLTHTKPVTIASLVSEIRHTISKSTVINRETISKLWGITEQLESLGGKR